MHNFEEALTGGHHNSLGNTITVVESVLNDKNQLKDLYQCYSSKDEVVRMRVSSAIKRICKEKPDWIYEIIDLLIDDMSTINQPSAQWTFAQLIMLLDKKLTDDERARAIAVLKNNLETCDDWIVLNFTMEVLTGYAQQDADLAQWLKPYLKKHTKDSRKSVAGRATRYLTLLEKA